MTDLSGSARAYPPPLRWVPSAPVRGRAGEACSGPQDIPRACIPSGSPDFVVILQAAHLAAMESTVTFTEAIVLYIARTVIERQETGRGLAAAVAALDHCAEIDRAADAQTLRITEGLLDKVLGEVLRFEAGCAAGSPGSAVRRMRTVAQRMIARAKP